MELYAPKYYKDFKCIADKCKNSCCIGWEIDIDKETLNKYKNLKSPYGASIIKTISKGKVPHFKLLKGERCPHLDENGLCKIIINEGENYLSDICREHPRFYNYTSVCEVGIGMSCEEAARVILSSPDYSCFEKIGEVDADFDGVEFDGRKERDKTYKILGDTTQNYNDRLEKIYKEYQIDKGNDEKYHKIIASFEYLDPGHKELFLGYSRLHRPKGLDEYLERFLAYFIYRHTTEAYDYEDYLARLSFALFCERLFASLIYINGAKSLDELIYIATIISSEIEYSEDNTEALMC